MSNQIRSFLIALLAASCAGADADRYLVLATTTSVSTSGLLDVLVPAWQRQSGADLRVAPAGSGRALQMLERGNADAVISHAPAAEAEFTSRNPHWTYRKVMYADFVLVGPHGDPAGVAGAKTVGDAMRRVAAGPAPFVSRADESGTHEREKTLWALAHADPPRARWLPSGAGMATTLRQASELGGYTLTDRPTFDRLKPGLSLRVVFEGGSELLNTYAVLTRDVNSQADRFAEWLATGGGRTLIRNFDVRNGRAPYQVWPLDRPRDRPDCLPF